MRSSLPLSVTDECDVLSLGLVSVDPHTVRRVKERVIPQKIPFTRFVFHLFFLSTYPMGEGELMSPFLLLVIIFHLQTAACVI